MNGTWTKHYIFYDILNNEFGINFLILFMVTIAALIGLFAMWSIL